MNIPDTSNLLLRWSCGKQDTVALSDFNKSQYKDMLWLCKMSIISFQKWFPDATCHLMFNGDDFDDFKQEMLEIDPKFVYPVIFENQREQLSIGDLSNPYHFYPAGVWWKWLPFRLDKSKHEISIDTDIICLNEPKTWYDWIDGSEEILIAPDRFETVSVSTTGDFCHHPLLVGKKPYNCGIVGQRAGVDFSQRFFETTRSVKFGHTHNSLFITEQGAINLWIRTLELEGVRHNCLDFKKNAWMRDFVFFLEKGIRVETVHAVTWHKKIAKALKPLLEAKIISGLYDDDKDFLEALVKLGKKMGFYSKHLLKQQFGDGADLGSEILIPQQSF